MTMERAFGDEGAIPTSASNLLLFLQKQSSISSSSTCPGEIDEHAALDDEMNGALAVDSEHVESCASSEDEYDIAQLPISTSRVSRSGRVSAPSKYLEFHKTTKTKETKLAKDGRIIGSRFDSSLSLLTKRFMDIVDSSGGTHLDLNEVSVQLGVQKRRLYDITNVLEGIGMVTKIGKNKVSVRHKSGVLGDPATEKSQATILQLEAVERAMDAALDNMTSKIESMQLELPMWTTVSEILDVFSASPAADSESFESMTSSILTVFPENNITGKYSKISFRSEESYGKTLDFRFPYVMHLHAENPIKACSIGPIQIDMGAADS